MAIKKIPVQPVPQKMAGDPCVFNFPVKLKIGILFFVAFCFYANSFSNEYALDDEAVIQTNEYVQKGFSGIGKILTTDAYDSYYRQSNSNQHLSGGRYRPLSIVLFAAEHQLWGESPHKRHAVNILLYILCVLSIFYFFRNYLFRKIVYGEDISFIAALLFAIHPLHTEVVANIKSSDEILSLIFIILTFIFSIKYRETKRKTNLLIALLCLFIALFAKEYALMLLFLLPLLFMVYYREKPRKSINSALPYYGVMAVYFFIRIYFIGFPHQQRALDILNNPYLFATPLQKIASEFFILGKYLYMLFIPYPLASDYGFAQIPYHKFSSPLVWLSIIAYTAIIFWGIKLLRKKNILAFPVFFFLLNLFMVSNLFINIGATMGERLIFHSSLGFTAILSVGIVDATQRLSIAKRRLFIMIFLDLLIVLFGIETINRNKDWKNNFTLFTKDVNTVPNSVKANDNAGAQYINFSETIKDTIQSDSLTHIGLKYLYKAIRLDDSDVNGYLNLGIAYCKLTDPDSAKHFWDIAKRIYSGEPHLPGYYLLLGKIFNYTGKQFAEHGKYPESINEFEVGIQCTPLNPDLWVNLGGTFFNMHQYDSARFAWNRAEKISPDYPKLNQYLGMLPKFVRDSNSLEGHK